MASGAPTWLYLTALASCCLCTVTSKDCAGTVDHLDGSNIQQFDGCAHVLGNLIINSNSTDSSTAYPLSHTSLLQLSSITEIDGYLSIQNFNLSETTDLRFLRRLEVIHGHQTVLFFGVQHYSLLITDNPHLRTLNLASLRRVERGGVRIVNNPSLCLVDTLAVEEYLVSSRLARVGSLAEDCSGVHCSEECVQGSGCWGTLPDECVMCRNYQYRDTCVSTCNTSLSYADVDSRQCVPLAPTNHTPYFTTPTTSNIFTQDSTNSTSIKDATSHPPVVATDDHRETSDHLIWTSVAGVIVVVLASIVITALCLAFLIFYRSKVRGSLKMGNKASTRKGTDDSEREAFIEHNETNSRCASRSSHISLTSHANSEFRVQGETGVKDSVKQTAETETAAPPSSKKSIVSEVDFGCYDITNLTSSHDSHVTSNSHVTSATNHSAFHDQAVSDDDTKEFSIAPFTTPRRHTTASPGMESVGKIPNPSPHFGMESATSTEKVSSLFPNWKPAVDVSGSSGVSPVPSMLQQRPKTMSGGGVYSTGHGHHQHLHHHHRRSNHSHGNISMVSGRGGSSSGGANSKRDSVTSGYGTGTSAWTSARTSLSTIGGSSGVFETVQGARDSITPSQTLRTPAIKEIPISTA